MRGQPWASLRLRGTEPHSSHVMHATLTNSMGLPTPPPDVVRSPGFPRVAATYPPARSVTSEVGCRSRKALAACHEQPSLRTEAPTRKNVAILISDRSPLAEVRSRGAAVPAPEPPAVPQVAGQSPGGCLRASRRRDRLKALLSSAGGEVADRSGGTPKRARWDLRTARRSRSWIGGRWP